MELTIEQALRQGVAAHKGGNLEEAERLYRAILRSDPKHADANHNLGVMAVSVNKADAALPLFKVALETNPKIEQFWFSYLDALIKEKQLEEAKKVLKKAEDCGVDKDKLAVLSQQLASEIEIPTPTPSALNSLLENFQNGRYDDAEQLAVSMTREFSKHPFGWKILGAVFAQTGRTSEAVNAFKKTVALSPQDAEAHNNLGATFNEQAKLIDAETHLRQAIDLQPNFAEAHNNLGNTLLKQGKLDECIGSYTRAINLSPHFVEAFNN